jgi:hypothetical protein
MKSSHKPGSLMHDLEETKKDIKRLKRGEEAEVSLPEAIETKKRLKRSILDAEREEREAALREVDPLQVPREENKFKPKVTTA